MAVQRFNVASVTIYERAFVLGSSLDSYQVESVKDYLKAHSDIDVEPFFGYAPELRTL
jgi:hypothetical protein